VSDWRKLPPGHAWAIIFYPGHAPCRVALDDVHCRFDSVEEAVALMRTNKMTVVRESDADAVRAAWEGGAA
jgi:hypothetical protein